MGLDAIKKIMSVLGAPSDDQYTTGALKADVGGNEFNKRFKEQLAASLSTGNYPNTQIYTPGNSVIADAANRPA